MSLGDFIPDSTVLLLIKAVELTIMVGFLIFSFLTLRQVDLMCKTVHTSIAFEVKLVAYLQLFVGIGVFIILLLR